MAKQFILLTMVAMIQCFISCSNDEISGYESPIVSIRREYSKNNVYSKQLIIDSVLEIVSALDEGTKRVFPRTIADVEYIERLSDPIEGLILSKPVYIVNFHENEGFAIASATSDLPPVLCVVDSGHYNFGEELPLGAVAMLNNIDGDLYSLSDNSEIAPWNNFNPDSVYVVWSTVSTGNVHGTQVSCRWGQRPRYNSLCPYVGDKRAPTGCVPVAVGQIMYYYGKNCEHNGNFYNWSILRNVVDTSSCRMYAAAWSGVSRLLCELGNQGNLNAEYHSDRTTAYTEYAPRTFENFGYQSGGIYSDYNYVSLTSEIVHDHPVLLSGRRTMVLTHHTNGQVDTTYSNGHCWVADQFMNVVRRVTVYDRYTFETLYSEELTQQYIHCNWGWNGSRNGFFLSGGFKYTSPLHYSTKSIIDTLQSSAYQYELSQVTGIRP